MTNQELALIFSVVGGVLMILLAIIGFFAAGAVRELKDIKLDVQKLCVAMGINVNDIENMKGEVTSLRIRADATDDFKTAIFRDYQLHKR